LGKTTKAQHAERQIKGLLFAYPLPGANHHDTAPCRLNIVILSGNFSTVENRHLTAPPLTLPNKYLLLGADITISIKRFKLEDQSSLHFCTNPLKNETLDSPVDSLVRCCGDG
jgi:hypothetical protein